MNIGQEGEAFIAEPMPEAQPVEAEPQREREEVLVPVAEAEEALIPSA